MEMSDLPKDLLEEIIYRVPVNSIRAVRSTCKSWNTITYDHSFMKKHFGKTIETNENEFLVVMMMENKVYLMNVNPYGIQQNDNHNVESSIMQKAKLTSLYDDEIYRVFHCDGLLLCIKKGIRLVVCNPYCGQTKCIKTKNDYFLEDQFALGYEKKKNSLLRNHKILVLHYKSFLRDYNCFEIYNFNSDSWKNFNSTRDLEIPVSHLGVSLKGNTYWFARERYIKTPITNIASFLICFDFTTERFGPHLHLPFHSSCPYDTVKLSSVREEQLAVFQCRYTLRTKIWGTTKINPKEVSWNKVFLAVNMGPFTGFQFKYWGGSFFIDEKNNVVVVPGKDVNRRRNLAYITRKNVYFKQVDLGESTFAYCWDPLVCSYFPSLVQINQAARVMQHQLSVLVGKDGSINCFGYFGFLYFLCIFLSYFCFR